MDYHPIISSNIDKERRRLESTVDQDLHSLSLNSLTTASQPSNAHSHSFVSASSGIGSSSSLEYPRGLDTTIAQHPPFEDHYHARQTSGPHGTPRASAQPRRASTADKSLFVGASPASTAGHHASAMTLGAGIFRGGKKDDRDDGEFDPERSLGRLVGELGRVVGSGVSDDWLISMKRIPPSWANFPALLTTPHFALFQPPLPAPFPHSFTLHDQRHSPSSSRLQSHTHPGPE
jgi:hypothetical protein